MLNIIGVGGSSFSPLQPEFIRRKGPENLLNNLQTASAALISNENDLYAVSKLKQTGATRGIFSEESLISSQIDKTVFRQGIATARVAEAVSQFAYSNEDTSKPNDLQTARKQGIAAVVYVADPEFGLPVVARFKDAAEITAAIPDFGNLKPIDQVI